VVVSIRSLSRWRATQILLGGAPSRRGVDPESRGARRVEYGDGLLGDGGDGVEQAEAGGVDGGALVVSMVGIRGLRQTSPFAQPVS
jgi:hypothetical protein